ncbi:MAG: hypothetical protein ABEJ98_01495 [Candidatus Nanohaloarchaea archaeon]
MAQTNESGGPAELDILNLQSGVVSQLSNRDDQPYDLGMHEDHYEQVENPGFSREFMEVAAEPLFQDFSTGRPNYTTDPDTELLEGDFEIIRNFSDYVQKHATSIAHPADIDVKMQFLQDYIGSDREERAARYAMEVARRLEPEGDVSAVEGVQLTTPYDFRDVMEVLDEHGYEELPEAEDADVFISYGPDRMSFTEEEFEEAYEIRNALNTRYQERDYVNKGEPPVMEILSEDE